MIYNPNRTAHNAGLTTKGQLITCPQNLKIFDIVNNHENIYYDKNWISDENVKQVGSTYPIEFFNVGDYIHNIRIHSLLKNNNSSIKKNQINSWLVRSAGSFAEILFTMKLACEQDFSDDYKKNLRDIRDGLKKLYQKNTNLTKNSKFDKKYVFKKTSKHFYLFLCPFF